MTNVMLNTQLYQKISADQGQYKAYLLILPHAEILEHASEHICRANILVAMKANDLNNARAKALLKSPTPLQTHTTNMQSGSIVNSRKKYGTQLKLYQERYYALNLQHLEEQKGDAIWLFFHRK